MAEVLDDGEFWLPPKFLSDDDDDDDVFVNNNNSNKGDEAETESVFYGSSDFDSRVDSVTETESDEDDYLVALLTRQMAHSSLKLNKEFSKNDNVFAYFNIAKGGFLSSSPQSTLSPLASACGCRGSSLDTTTHQNARSRLDLLYAAAAPPNDNRGYNYNNLLCSQRQIKALYLEQMMKQAKARMMMGGHMQQQKPSQNVQNRGVGFVLPNKNADLLGLSHTAWPPIQQEAKQSIRRAVFAGKRECAGTGVFLPRRVHTQTETPRKKPTVFIPAKVVHALNLNLEEMGGQSQTHFQAPFNGAKLYPFYNNGGGARFQGNSGAAHPVQGGIKWGNPVVSQEARLPREWTY